MAPFTRESRKQTKRFNALERWKKTLVTSENKDYIKKQIQILEEKTKGMLKSS